MEIKEYFARLYGRAIQPVLVLDREMAVVWRSDAVEDLLARLGMTTENALLTPSLLREAEECFQQQFGSALPVLFGEQLFTMELTPAFYADAPFMVLRAVEKPAVLADGELLQLLRNSNDNLRTYLNYIYGTAQRIGLDTEYGKPIGDNVRRILRIADHLRYALDEEGQLSYRVPMDAERFVTLYFQNAGRLGARIQKLPGAEKEPLMVRMMPERMETVLNILVSNAVRFGGGALISTERRGDRICIAVRDNGPGVAEPMKLFQWGYRTTDAEGKSGLGFGLPLARKLLEKQGAMLEYEREEGSSCFRIVMEQAQTMQELRTVDWVAEAPENTLSQMRIELSDILGD